MKNNYLKLTTISLGIALNLMIGAIAYAFKIPLYLDAIGTILITLLLGWKSGATVGVISFLIGGLFNPVLPYFCLTQIAIACYIYIALKMSFFNSNFKIILVGIILGFVCAIISAPVIAYLFGGITGNGNSLITAYLISTGQSIIKSVALSGIASEPIDKLLQTLIAVWIIRSIPTKVLIHYNLPLLMKNKLK